MHDTYLRQLSLTSVPVSVSVVVSTAADVALPGLVAAPLAELPLPWAPRGRLHVLHVQVRGASFFIIID